METLQAFLIGALVFVAIGVAITIASVGALALLLLAELIAWVYDILKEDK